VTSLKPSLSSLALPALVFLVALALFLPLARSGAPVSSPAADPPPLGALRTTDERIAVLLETVRSDPKSAAGWVQLGGAHLQKVRENGDASHYSQAEQAFERARSLDPADASAVNGQALLALAQHDFPAALSLARRARALAPETVAPLGALVDAQVELGRYGAAERTLQGMLDRKPTLAAYARASYLRELRGDLDGAVSAMKLAVSSGIGEGENLAFAQAQLGNLELQRGRISAAEQAYRSALATFPAHVPASAGLARVAAARGDLGLAIRRYRDVVTRLPLPEHVIALGELELAAGRRDAARRDLALVEAERRLLQSNGVNVDVELAIFEADHGSPGRAVDLARRAYAAAPSVRSADALGWALTRHGRAEEGLRLARRALRLGWRDPLALYHAGVAAREAGDENAARRWLKAADTPALAPLHRRAL
jgi:tetratricopeptide (TPR) repeat protein